MKSFLVIGMGRFGRHLASKFVKLGNDVLIVDENANIVNELSSKFTDAYVGDATNDMVIKSLGVQAFDMCFVTIGDNFQSSLVITSLLKENGAKKIVSRATADIQAKFLKQIGADEVIYAERDLAETLAIKYSANNVFDYIEVSDDYAIYELPIMNSWIGKTIVEIDVRKKYNVNIIAIKKNGEIVSSPIAKYMFEKDDHIMVIGTKIDIEKLTKKIN